MCQDIDAEYEYIRQLTTQHVPFVHIRDRTARLQLGLFWCLLDAILACSMEMRSLRLQQQREQEEADRMRPTFVGFTRMRSSEIGPYTPSFRSPCS